VNERRQNPQCGDRAALSAQAPRRSAQPAAEYLFAYGTLTCGTGHRDVDLVVATCCVPVAMASVQGRLYNLGDYPGMVRSADPAERVYGVLFRLQRPQQCLATLDRYEGFMPQRLAGSEFVRVRTTALAFPGNRATIAWCYLYNGSVRYRQVIARGCYEPARRCKSKLAL
jgi:pyruvate carboxylase